ncbi:MAG: lipoyl(octanoyl) transferase LipB [Gemmatimonadetes bacterium]|nr:lipoyl(octanoyl) transferase LipB [Gemmatimonadota bacterium]
MAHPTVSEPSPAGAARRVLEIRRLGMLPFAQAHLLQEDLVTRRRAGEIPDQLLLLQHPHVITLGSGSHAEHVLADPGQRNALGIDLLEAGRGGDVTYHGPGQLVGYPILDLKPDRRDVHRYLRDLEEVLIRVLDGYGIESRRVEGMTGVWTDSGKVAAIGIRVSSGWITSHGFALNVGTDLSFFETIVPCGIAGSTVTSLEHLVGRPVPITEVAARTASAFANVFDRSVSEVGGEL